MNAGSAVGPAIEASQVLEALPIGAAWIWNGEVRTNARLREQLNVMNSVIPLDEFGRTLEIRDPVTQEIERDRVSEALLPTGPAPRRVELRMRDGQHFGAVLCPVSVGPDAGRGAILACEEAPPAKEYRPPAFWMAALLHEIRGAAQILSLAISTILKTNHSITPERHDLLQRNLAVLRRTIVDLSEAVSVGEGRILFHPARIQLLEFVGRMVEIESQLDMRHRFTWSAPTDLEARADPDRLHQIVTNLLTNATKYAAPGTIELGAEPERDRVLLWIQDEGPGISEKDQELLFQPYSRLSTRREGSGLGLWIARELSRGMGGDLWLRSSLGRSSTFYLALPR